MSTARNLHGYANQYPDARWPNGAQLAVSVVLNVEEGAELALSAGDERNEAVHEVTHEVKGAPDLCMESHFEYGARVGYWRITRRLDALGIPLTLNACSRALEATPWIARHATERGYEVCCHGWRWESHAGMAEAAERALIQRAVTTIARLHGKPPVGWHTKSSASVNTRRLLVEHGGFLYDSDAYNDDCPYYVEVLGRPHLVVPYVFDTNDMRFVDSFAFVRASDFADYVVDSFDCLWREGAHQPKMMSIGLHTRIIGRAGRIKGLQTALEHMQAKGKVWFARREDIARHWWATVPVN
ncbi:MAG: polysaccharide deacetylase family protein [Burkholderiales bacterium]